VETGKGVLEFLEKASVMERRLKAMEEGAARIKAEELVKKTGVEGEDGSGRVIIEAFPDTDIDEVLRIGRAVQKLSAAVFILAAEKDFKFAAFCAVKGLDIRPLVKGAFEAAGGRGGGGPSFFQGSYASAGELAEFLSLVRGGENERKVCFLA
jgi:alanyl-tRNA synthetase